MITYEEYYAQQKRVEAAANAIDNLDDTLKLINTTGLRPTEQYWKYAGVAQRLITNCVTTTDEDIRLSDMRSACRVLIAAIRSFDKEVDFSLFTVEEVEFDPVLLSIFEQRMSDFCRMNPLTFMGYASMIISHDAAWYADSTTDYETYFLRMLTLLADYAITHGIDLEHLLCS